MGKMCKAIQVMTVMILIVKRSVVSEGRIECPCVYLFGCPVIWFVIMEAVPVIGRDDVFYRWVRCCFHHGLNLC